MSLWGLWCVIGHMQLSLHLWGPHWGINNCRLFNYLSDFAEDWLKCVYMCQNDTCEIICQSDHPFNSCDQKSNAPYMSIIR